MPPVTKTQTPQETKDAAIVEQVEIEADLAENPRDVTIPGGRYKRGDLWVNAEGKAIDKSGKVLKTDDDE